MAGAKKVLLAGVKKSFVGRGKKVMLAGVKKVLLADQTTNQMKDLSADGACPPLFAKIVQILPVSYTITRITKLSQEFKPACFNNSSHQRHTSIQKSYGLYIG